MWSDFEETIVNKFPYRGHSLMGFIIGIPIPAVTIWLWTRPSTGFGCETFINIPILILGILVLILTVSGSCARKPWSASCCTRETMVTLVLFAILGFGIFILAVSSAGGGRLVSTGTGFQDYVLDDYSHWFQKRVNNTSHWDHLKRCIVKKKVCHKFFDEYINDTQPQFFARLLSSIESGCCKPPTNCNFTYTSSTHWTKPKDGNNTNNIDCNAWNEDPNILCFNCQSCKAGLADDIKSNWTIVGIVIIVVISLILFVSPCKSCKGGIYTACIFNTASRMLAQSDDLYF